MDNEVFKNNLRKAIKMLPAGFVNPKALAEHLLKFKPQLEKIVPDLIDTLSQDFMTAAFEKTTGTLDGEGLERAAMEVVAEFGFTPPVVMPAGNMNDLVSKVE